ncbi:hydroxyquinol 1,2-dioxygenase [Pseudooceanicola sp. CBS1P-1]|uniref:Hydroxyquinol 1,2-dioxygenase n=1 Tax=Pseudooceanicola albus TaxID=2692189 RepID=A0A6L7G2M1_9RHOB|nr:MULTISPECIES: dioxygenase [Pseudooceanicola]MBT9385094.1 hydroxyquinol 1,2-dioxygenase [Pseudooceanicola endophyticus]MXN18614.1 hydroxyquinol 1,2-dioxygenase [Pseudooceanicola albus]
MRNITLENITEAVVASLGAEIPARNREILESALKHIHLFMKDVNLSYDEWMEAMEWMRRAGDISSDARNEFILISDILGVEVLADMIDKKPTHNETISTVLGPFYRDNPPVLPKGASIIQKDFEGQETVRVSGQIRDTDGTPVPGVTIDVWEDAPNGLYEQQDPDQPDFNLRGRLETDAEGRYEFVGIRPVPYPIPYDGAAGELLKYMGHHPMRPGHIHFMVMKDGYKTLISQIYDSETEYLDNDSVFAVKEDLIGELKPAPEGADTDYVMTFDFVIRNNAVLAQAAE